MKANTRSLFSPKDLDARRNRRALNRRIKPTFRKSRRCHCSLCTPWPTQPTNWDDDEPTTPRTLRLRHHAISLLEELTAFFPRLIGALAQPDTNLPFFEGIELDVARDALAAASAHLARMGYRIEPLRDGARVGIEAMQLEPIVVWARDAAAPEVGLTREELEGMIATVHDAQGARLISKLMKR